MVRAIMIVEMAGRPAGHLTESLEKHINILNDVNDIEVHSIKVSEPTEIKMEEGAKEVPKDEVMLTAFAEAEFECDSFARLSETMFDFMPSSVEVIEPVNVTMDMGEATNLLNNISGRMHRYDEIAKIAGARMQQMGAQLEMMQKVLSERDAEILKLGKGKSVKKVKKTSRKKVVKKKAAKK
jgi:hypothetical protein